MNYTHNANTIDAVADLLRNGVTKTEATKAAAADLTRIAGECREAAQIARAAEELADEPVPYDFPVDGGENGGEKDAPDFTLEIGISVKFRVRSSE